MALARTPPLDFRIKRHRRLRAVVFTRDGFRCISCGWTPNYIRPEHLDGSTAPYDVAAGRGLQLDHIVPRTLGGPSEASNLQTLCSSCNASKCARTDWEGVA